MIFGYNTDVRAGDIVYHVQTEDRGEKNPVIDTVVYVKGRIVERRCTPYVPDERTPEQLQDLAKQQHRALVEAIRSGSYRAPVQAPAAAAPARSERSAAAPGSGKPGSGKPESGKPDWSQLAAPEPHRSSAHTCSLELVSTPEMGQDLVFRVKVSDTYSGQPAAGALVRALLRDHTGEETLREASASEDGIAEISFRAPVGGKATVLFQATGAVSSETLRFNLRRAR